MAHTFKEVIAMIEGLRGSGVRGMREMAIENGTKKEKKKSKGSI